MLEKLKKEELFPPKIVKSLKKWEKCYPSNKKRSVIIPGLHILQDYNNGYLTKDLMNKLSLYLEVPSIEVYEVATFYTMYDLKKVGRHKLNVCTNISCLLNGAEEIVTHIEKKLSIKAGEMTSDGRVTLKTVECQGACCGAPMLEVDKVFYEKLTIDKVNKIIDSLE